MGENDTNLLCVDAANILMHSAHGTQTRETMKCAGFKKVDIKYDTYQKRIYKLKKKIVTSKLSQIVVRDDLIVTSHPWLLFKSYLSEKIYMRILKRFKNHLMQKVSK